MRLLMKKTVDGSRDGKRTETFLEGRSYEFGSTAGRAKEDVERELELQKVFLGEGWAVEAPQQDAAAPVTPADSRPVYRLPLVEEYVAAGYKAENYEDFLKEESSAAEKNGFRVEVRAKNADELAAEEKDRQEHAAREAEIDKERAEREAARTAEATPEVQPPTPAPRPPAPAPEVPAEVTPEAPAVTPPEAPKSKSNKRSR